MEFFDFFNSETFHYFKWLCDTRQNDVDSFLKDALDSVEADEWFQMGQDVSTTARDNLAEILGEDLKNVAAELGVSLELDGIPEDRCVSGPMGLAEPLMVGAMQRIDCQHVAKALLIRAGKWAPDKVRPEVL